MAVNTHGCKTGKRMEKKVKQKYSNWKHPLETEVRPIQAFAGC